MTILLSLFFLASAPLATARWLRIAQREHYLPGSVTLFAWRWWTLDWKNTALAVASLAGIAASFMWPLAALVPIEIAAFGPVGLSMRGRTSRLAWTRRLKTLAVVHAVLVIVVCIVGVLLGYSYVAFAATALGLPLVLDAALLILVPVEKRSARTFVDQAVGKLDRVDPTRVAITGSYGKTTIKGYVRHIVEGTRSVVASPASFNNTGGLSRTVNEHLTPDTEVFVAEMGTYGPGEIRDLCSWVKPDVSALCNIGPVHLERMGSLDGIVAAKSEIFETAPVAVLNIDAHGLAAVAERLRADPSKRVLTTSTDKDSSADIRVFVPDDAGSPGEAGEAAEPSVLVCIGDDCGTATLPNDTILDNVAVAVALAFALDVSAETIRTRLASLPGAGHRRERSVSPTGVTVIDDTYNSNPAGAAAALEALANTSAARRVVVTPGMVEMGDQQYEANEEFAHNASQVADVVVVVGRTNAGALLAGANKGTAEVRQARTRVEAVEWVRTNLTTGDAVLYENDLPDHYP